MLPFGMNKGFFSTAQELFPTGCDLCDFVWNWLSSRNRARIRLYIRIHL
jgi:hypothetical protein